MLMNVSLRRRLTLALRARDGGVRCLAGKRNYGGDQVYWDERRSEDGHRKVRGELIPSGLGFQIGLAACLYVQGVSLEKSETLTGAACTNQHTTPQRKPNYRANVNQHDDHIDNPPSSSTAGKLVAECKEADPDQQQPTEER